MQKTSKMAAFSAAAVATTIAIAATYGPFYISAAGPEYVNMDLNSDTYAEYQGAQKIASIYLAPMLNTPSKIASAIQNDYIRVVYANGAQIADFKIKRWPSSIPVDFASEVGSITAPHLSPNYKAQAAQSCTPGPQGTYHMTYATGFWGQTATYSEDMSQVTITASWVQTPSVTISTTGTYFTISHYCP